MINYDNVPNQLMVGGLQRYFENRIKPGDFLTALLANDLVGAFGAADATNTRLMKEWVGFLYNHMPARPNQIWGSYEAIANYLKGDRDE